MDINWFTLAMTLFGGLALFLFGMEQMTESMKLVAGKSMKSLLARMTGNRFSALFTGAFVTAIIQSSSVTTVLVVGFISAGLMTLAQSIGVILGANIGTTITAQIIAFKVTKYALILVTVGFVMLFVSKKRNIQQYGGILMGLGLIFFGMDMMSEATKPLRDYEPFINMMKSMENPLFGILVAAVFTAIVQSSSATTGVVIVLASEGFITLEAGIALALGANIGTCITAYLASIGKPTEAKQAALVHVLFNVLGVLLWVGFIDYFAAFIQSFSPSSANLTGIDKIAHDAPRQIANAHTFFNAINAFLFLGFTTQLAKLVQWILPVKEDETDDSIVKVKYLNEDMIQTPELAFTLAKMEMERLTKFMMKMLKKTLKVVLSGGTEDLIKLREKDEKIDILHGKIVSYLGKLSGEKLNDDQTELLHDLLGISNHVESIADIVESELVDLGIKRLEDDIQISEETWKVLEGIYDKIIWSTKLVYKALKDDNYEQVRLVIDSKQELDKMVSDAEWHLQNRFTADEPNRLQTFNLEMSFVKSMRRIYYFTKRMAKDLLEIDENPEELTLQVN